MFSNFWNKVRHRTEKKPNDLPQILIEDEEIGKGPHTPTKEKPYSSRNSRTSQKEGAHGRLSPESAKKPKSPKSKENIVVAIVGQESSSRTYVVPSAAIQEEMTLDDFSRSSSSASSQSDLRLLNVLVEQENVNNAEKDLPEHETVAALLEEADKLIERVASEDIEDDMKDNVSSENLTAKHKESKMMNESLNPEETDSTIQKNEKLVEKDKLPTSFQAVEEQDTLNRQLESGSKQEEIVSVTSSGASEISSSSVEKLTEADSSNEESSVDSSFLPTSHSPNQFYTASQIVILDAENSYEDNVNLMKSTASYETSEEDAKSLISSENLFEDEKINGSKGSQKLEVNSDLTKTNQLLTSSLSSQTTETKEEEIVEGKESEPIVKPIHEIQDSVQIPYQLVEERQYNHFLATFDDKIETLSNESSISLSLGYLREIEEQRESVAKASLGEHVFSDFQDKSKMTNENIPDGLFAEIEEEITNSEHFGLCPENTDYTYSEIVEKFPRKQTFLARVTSTGVAPNETQIEASSHQGPIEHSENLSKSLFPAISKCTYAEVVKNFPIEEHSEVTSETESTLEDSLLFGSLFSSEDVQNIWDYSPGPAKRKEEVLEELKSLHLETPEKESDINPSSFYQEALPNQVELKKDLAAEILKHPHNRSQSLLLCAIPVQDEIAQDYPNLASKQKLLKKKLNEQIKSTDIIPVYGSANEEIRLGNLVSNVDTSCIEKKEHLLTELTHEFPQRQSQIVFIRPELEYAKRSLSEEAKENIDELMNEVRLTRKQQQPLQQHYLPIDETLSNIKSKLTNVSQKCLNDLFDEIRHGRERSSSYVPIRDSINELKGLLSEKSIILQKDLLKEIKTFDKSKFKSTYTLYEEQEVLKSTCCNINQRNAVINEIRHLKSHSEYKTVDDEISGMLKDLDRELIEAKSLYLLNIKSNTTSLKHVQTFAFENGKSTGTEDIELETAKAPPPPPTTTTTESQISEACHINLLNSQKDEDEDERKPPETPAYSGITSGHKIEKLEQEIHTETEDEDDLIFIKPSQIHEIELELRKRDSIINQINLYRKDQPKVLYRNVVVEYHEILNELKNIQEKDYEEIINSLLDFSNFEDKLKQLNANLHSSSQSTASTESISLSPISTSSSTKDAEAAEIFSELKVSPQLDDKLVNNETGSAFILEKQAKTEKSKSNCCSKCSGCNLM